MSCSSINETFDSPRSAARVAPIGVRGFFRRWGWDVLMSELFWVWLPLAVLLLIVRVVRKQGH